MFTTDKKIRVMHLIHQLGTGGAENGIINLLNHINKEFFETSICAFVGNGTQTARLDQRVIRLFELDKRAGNDFTLPIRLWRLCRKWRPHILHTHAWGTLCEGIIGARLARIPVVIHGEHGTIQQKAANICVQRMFWNFTNQILTVSKAHKENLTKTIGYPPSRIKVIINGVDTKRFSNVKKSESIRDFLGITEKDIVIGIVGRLVPVKNQKMLIKAFAILARRYLNVKLILVGDGPLKNELFQLAASLGVSSRVMFLGRRSDIPEILQSMDIFVLTSISEGMSNTILEAMSSRLPVVASDVGGNSEIVKKDVTGFLVPSNNKNALVDALKILIENPVKRNEMGVAGRKLIEMHFSLETMVENYENLYKDCLRKSRFNDSM
ncbi:MAG: glycosyltransferase [Candidatus Kariarchaeaceae archaeon]